MSKANYVIREDGMPVMITAESDFDFIDSEEILNDYPYITESMNEALTTTQPLGTYFNESEKLIY